MDNTHHTTFEEDMNILLKWVSYYGHIPLDDDFASSSTVSSYLCAQPSLPSLWKTTQDVLKAILFHCQRQCLDHHTSPSNDTPIKDLLFDWIMTYLENAVSSKKVHCALYNHIKKYPLHGCFFLQHQKNLWSKLQKINAHLPLFSSFIMTQKAELAFHIIFPLAIHYWIHDDGSSLDRTMAFVDQTLEKFYGSMV